MALTLMYITNNPTVAEIAQKAGVDRIWVDLETLGKNIRQEHMDSVKSHHTISDIRKVKTVTKQSELLVRVNPINPESAKEIDAVIDAGADMIMLPMWKSVDDVKAFLSYVRGRVRTTLLLETKEAVECIDDVLAMGGFDEIHIGLNDLHLSYGLTFMFELLSNGIVEMLCNKIQAYNIPYGFGGIAQIGTGMLPAELIVMEHYRLGSTRAILSRSFCNCEKVLDPLKVQSIFEENIAKLRQFEHSVLKMTNEDLIHNQKNVCTLVNNIMNSISGRNQ